MLQIWEVAWQYDELDIMFHLNQMGSVDWGIVMLEDNCVLTVPRDDFVKREYILVEYVNIHAARQKYNRCSVQGPLLLTWFNFNPSMDK